MASFLNDLRPVTFKWKKEKDIPTTLNGYKADSETRYKTDTTEHGFIAQEVKTVIDAHSEIKDGFDMWSENGSDGRQRKQCFPHDSLWKRSGRNKIRLIRRRYWILKNKNLNYQR